MDNGIDVYRGQLLLSTVAHLLHAAIVCFHDLVRTGMPDRLSSQLPLLLDVMTHILCRREFDSLCSLHAKTCEGLPVSVDSDFSGYTAEQ